MGQRLHADQYLQDYAFVSFSDRPLVDGSKQNGVCQDGLKDPVQEIFAECALANRPKQNGVSRTMS